MKAYDLLCRNILAWNSGANAKEIKRDYNGANEELVPSGGPHTERQRIRWGLYEEDDKRADKERGTAIQYKNCM